MATGWFVSFGPMLYVPFIIGGLSAGVQVFSDYWFTIGSVLYSISMLIQASHLLFDNHVTIMRSAATKCMSPRLRLTQTCLSGAR